MNVNVKYLPRLVPVIAYLLTAGSNIAVVPQAQAANGQCRWENGPGFPTHSSCQNEDCLGNGGRAFCTKPELRPPLNRNESQVDGQMFGYSMCDIAAASIPKIAQWCAAQGGNWVDMECRNLSADYPGVGSASNEGAALAAGQQFATRNGALCPTLTERYGMGADRQHRPVVLERRTCLPEWRIVER